MTSRARKTSRSTVPRREDGAPGSGSARTSGVALTASTRRAPYVQLVDVAPTVLELLGEPVPDDVDGEPWQVRGPAPTVERLVMLSERATTARAVTVPFFVVLVAVLRAPQLRLRSITTGLT